MAKNGFWSRFRTIFNAKAHKSLDKLEDGERINILKQKVRELKTGHGTSVEGLAKVKALQFKFEKEAKSLEDKAKSYQDKASKLKSRYDSAPDDSKDQLKSDILLMLNRSENTGNEAKTKSQQAVNQKAIVSNLETKIKSMSTLIKETEYNITNMEARAEAAKVNKEISKELSGVNFDGVGSQIEEIEKKINEDNAEAEAWTEIDTALEDDEDRIEKMLNDSSPTEDSKLFEDFMKK